MNAALRLVDSPAWTIAGWSLLHYLWIGAVLGVAAWLLRRAVRPLSPQARYAAAVATFAALAVAPPCIAWRVATHRGGESAPAVAPLAAAAEQPLPLDPTAPTRLAPALPASVLPPLPPAAPPVETIDAFVARHGTNLLSIAVHWAPAVWLVGMPLTFAFLATGLIGAERLRQRSSLLVDGPIAEAARRWAEALRITRAVAVGVSDRVVAPLVIGIVRPMIVLPAAIVARQSPEQMEMILLHELSHVRRADNLVNLIQRVVEAVLFFQPAVWFVSRWVRLEREHCCDNMVLSYTGDPQGYAETLASLAMPGISPAYAAAAMANHQLVSRIQHILSKEEQPMSLSPKIVAIAGAICLVIGLSLSGAAQTSPEVEKPSAADDATPTSPSEPAASIADAPSGRVTSVDGLAEGATYYSGEYVAAVDEGLKAGANATPPDAASTGLTVGSDETVGVTLGQNSDSGILGVTGDLYVIPEKTGNKRPWGPEQATGAPDVPQAGDDARAWAALTQDDQDEWLELTYAEPVEVVAVQVFANYCVGAVSRVTVFDAHTAGLQYTWEGKDPVKTSGPYSRGVSIVTIPASIRTNRVRIELASKSVVGWNEIDAVGLLDANGKTHWATGATASSTYAERAGATVSSADASMQRLLYRQAIAQAQLALEDAASAQLLAQMAQPKRKTRLDGRDWSPDQATGAPADLSVADVNDRTHAWRPAEPDAGRETLRIVYNEPVKAKLLLVYELGEPGVVDIVCRDAQQTEFRVLSERNPKSAAAGVLSLPLDGKLAVSSVVLGLDTAAKPGWTDIDAVGLIDDQGQVHWGDWAQATSTRADVADRTTKANRLDRAWRHPGRQTSNASCASCHKEDAATGSADNRQPARMRVGDLLDMSDSELRDWLKQHDAANIHIDEDGGATVQGGAVDFFFDAIQTRPKQPGNGEKRPTKPHDADPNAVPANRGSQADPRNSRGSDPNNANGDVLVVDASKSITEPALDALDPKRVRANQAHPGDVANRIDAYQRAFDAQVAAAARRQGDPKADKNKLDGHQRLEDWLAAANALAAAEQVQIALAAGERGHFSLPDRTIVCAERVETKDAKNVLSITITNDGALEFVGSEPGAGRLRCWDQNGRTIDVAITVKAGPLPATDPRAEPKVSPKSSPKPDPRDASKADAAMAIDRLVLERLDKGVAAENANADPQTVARRAYLDLLGVPPTAEQIEAFVGDGSEETLARSMRKLADEAAASDAKEPPIAPRP
ncbi:MAG: hypothetical protein DCC68_14250 [Planctomycetota bacterium]|nr:MAG: hypothetical protein DCC68_14250 [Planctomycetota bacterium]